MSGLSEIALAEMASTARTAMSWRYMVKSLVCVESGVCRVRMGPHLPWFDELN